MGGYIDAVRPAPSRNEKPFAAAIAAAAKDVVIVDVVSDKAIITPQPTKFWALGTDKICARIAEINLNLNVYRSTESINKLESMKNELTAELERRKVVGLNIRDN